MIPDSSLKSLTAPMQGGPFEELEDLDHRMMHKISEAYWDYLRLCLKTYRQVARNWNLTDPQAAKLIDVGLSTWRLIRDEDDEIELEEEQIQRMVEISILASHLSGLFLGGLGERWPTMPNKGELFHGLTPVEVMMRGGVEKMRAIRGLIWSLELGDFS